VCLCVCTISGCVIEYCFSVHQSSMSSQILVENRDFCLHSTSPLALPRRNIAITFGSEKLERCGYPMVKKFEDMPTRLRERDRQTDERLSTRPSARRHRPRLRIAWRGKTNQNYIYIHLYFTKEMVAVKTHTTQQTRTRTICASKNT